ncbi:MAG TPA: hypothetical protein VK928_01215 [Longimicrobiales bacterium]|nr:hypothetical protein [Longimicrobiales bacterium]
MSDRTLGRRIRVYGVGVAVLAVIGSAALFGQDGAQAASVRASDEVVVKAGVIEQPELSTRQFR